MKRFTFSLLALWLLAAAPNLSAAEGVAKVKPADPDRIAGMKEALADLEKGFLKIKGVPPPSSPWEDEYRKLLKQECGIDNVYVSYEETSTPKLQARMEGYNDLMLLEIEHRYGRDIFERLGKKAMDDYFKARGGK